jgi:DNA-directed RNA polymerase specialized sigma24 family protein
MPTTTKKQAVDEVMVALEELLAALDENLADAQRIRTRAAAIKSQRKEGRTNAEIVPEGEHPLIPELVSLKLERLFNAGSKLRRAEAKALHDEGLSMDAIGELFGVTRQRVSALLKSTRHTESEPRGL